MTRRLLWLAPLALALGCGSDLRDQICTSDDACDGSLVCEAGVCVAADAGGPDDTGGDPDAITDPAQYCDDLPVAENLGVACDGEAAEFCGDGGTCVTTSDGAVATCAQLCFSQLCGDTCTPPRVCTGLSTAGGAPAGLDLDGDGVNDTDIGACVERPEGDVPVFGSCGGQDFCIGGTDCLVTEEGTDRGRCYPRCEAGVCADIDGVPAACVLVISSAPGAEPTHCLAECTEPGAADACPATFTCVSNGSAAVCLPPGLDG